MEKGLRMDTTPPLVAPRASIITVNFNGLHHMVKYLPSVYASRGNFEVIIADNGSRDGSLEHITSHYPAVQTLPLGANIGFSAANNKAVGIARGEILVFLNPDTQVHPDWLLHLLRPFDDPSVGLTTSKILLMSNPDRINTCGNTIHISGLVLCRGLGKGKDLFVKPEEVAAVSGAAFAIRRDLFTQLGGFDEKFFMYLEDTDLSLRSRLAGWKCVSAPESLVWHDYALRFGSQKVFDYECNRYRMLLKSLRWPTLFVLGPVFLLAEMISWGFILWSDPSNWRNKLRAYGEIKIHWREILRTRSVSQAQRRRRDRDLLRFMGSELDFFQFTRSIPAYLAAVIFNPLFFLLRIMVFLLVWW
jgi:hypothetical protein